MEMTKILYLGTHGTDDLTRGFYALSHGFGGGWGRTAAEINLAGDAVVCIQDKIIESIKGVGMPSLKELMENILNEKVLIYIWGGCAEARGVSERDLIGKNAKIINPKIAADLVVEADRVVTF